MVFQPEAQFRQLSHCGFRENIIKLLYIPTLNSDPVYLIVNKYGKIGMYDPITFVLIHSYVLDLTVPMYPSMPKHLQIMAKYNKRTNPVPRCQKTHMIVDAVYCPDFKSCIFLTSKGILQCYDIGEIEAQSLGLELLPRKEFMGLKFGEPVLEIRNHGHVETHRLYGLHEFPTCMYYYHYDCDQRDKDNAETTTESDRKKSKLLIGDSEGCITIISIDNQLAGYLFGLRKIRRVIHEIKALDLFNEHLLIVYKGHHGPVSHLMLLNPRQLILSCSTMDHKFSLFVNDLLVQSNKSYVVPLKQGINTFAHSNPLKMIVTGSDDKILRLFNEFITKIPQMELLGHKAPIIAVEFINVSFSKSQLLMSFSKDVELRAWDPVNFICLQSLYISFPPKSIITCKTPEFARNCLYIHQPHYQANQQQQQMDMNLKTSDPDNPQESQDTYEPNSKKTKPHIALKNQQHDGDLILFYCNSCAKLYIDKDTSHWPFEFDDFIDEFEETTAKFEQKLLHKQKSISRNPKCFKSKIVLSKQDLAGIEQNLDSFVTDILGVKKYVDAKLGIRRSFEFQEATSKPSKLEQKFQKDSGPDSFDEFSVSKMSLSTQALRRFHSLERIRMSAADSGLRKSYPNKSSSSRHDFTHHGMAFKSLPIYDLSPITFKHKKLPLTEAMKEFGIKNVESADDLLTPEARSYFSDENMKQVQNDLKLTEKTLRTETGRRRNSQDSTNSKGAGSGSDRSISGSGSKSVSASSSSKPSSNSKSLREPHITINRVGLGLELGLEPEPEPEASGNEEAYSNSNLEEEPGGEGVPQSRTASSTKSASPPAASASPTSSEAATLENYELEQDGNRTCSEVSNFEDYDCEEDNSYNPDNEHGHPTIETIDDDERVGIENNLNSEELELEMNDDDESAEPVPELIDT